MRARAVAISLAAHGLLFLVVLTQITPPPVSLRFEPEPIPVRLAERPPPPEPPPKPDPAPSSPPPAAAPLPARLVPAQPEIAPRLVAEAVPEAPIAELTDAQAAGARTAGSGSGTGAGPGAGCDMVDRLEAALRKDPQVRAAVAAAHRGRPLLLWNGDWIQTPGQSGKGLAGVRQAIALEVAFAPEPCRAEPMHGLVLLSLADGPAAPRVALGAETWRWTQLLGRRG